MPIFGKPFERISMDIVGPLPKSSAGNRFILVINDLATRYPEAIPMRTVKSPKIAEELAKYVSRHGIPKEILTDNGTNFISTYIRKLYEILGIKQVLTTPFHPQTNGVTERFNGTLISMLRRFVRDDVNQWDKMLPYVLFAYRETPHQATGFSPFELLYGTNPRGVLDIL